MRTGSSQTTEQTAHVVVPHAIKTLKAKGYKLVTVAECLGMNPYQSVGTPQSVSLVCLRLCIPFPYQFLSGLVDMLVPRTKGYIGNSFFPDHEPLSWTMDNRTFSLLLFYPIFALFHTCIPDLSRKRIAQLFTISVRTFQATPLYIIPFRPGRYADIMSSF